MKKIPQLLSVAAVIIGSCFLFSAQVFGQTDVAFPADAGVLNVKDTAYAGGAKGDGVTDDTAAFKAAIKAALNTAGGNQYGGMAILYIPNGTYLLSDTLQNRNGGAYSDGWISGLYLQGQSQTGTILKLQNSCSGFTSASSPKAVIQTGSENPYPNAAKTVTSLTSTGTTAICVCPSHGFTTGQAVNISGETPTGYNTNYNSSVNQGYNVITVIDANTFSYTVPSGLASPATGTIKAANYTAGEGNQAFRHYIRNLTVDVGTGNAGAVGIDYLVNNQGGIYNVTIKSSDSLYAGYTGLMMDRSYPGPGIIKNLTVTGFATGISMRSARQYGMTFDNIALSHQTSYGIDNYSNTMSIEGLTSSNSVPVIYEESTPTHLALINATFTGGSSANNAITGSGAVYCRNVKSTGYGNVIYNANGNNVAGNGSTPVTVSEYESTATYKGFTGNVGGSIQLPIEETPDFFDTTTSDWKNAATAAPVVGGDYLASIQAAIDSGATTVYLPELPSTTGKYEVSDTIHLRGNVQKFIGCCAIINPTSSFPAGHPMIEFDGGTAPFVDIQNIRIQGNVVHNSSADLALENSKCEIYSNTSSAGGAFFAEDADIGVNSGSNVGGLEILNPQYVWARQLNIEGLTTASVVNDGGVAWLFGFKTENQSTSGSIIDNESGGWTELMGGFFYVTSSTAPTVPMILNNHSSLSADYIMDPYESKDFPESVQDIQGSTINFTNTNCPLYSGATAAYPVPTALASYTFASSSVASNDTDANSTASNFLNGSGYTNTAFTTSQREVIGAGISGDTAAQDYAAGQYFNFTLTANSGKTLDLSELNITTSRGQSSPPSVTVYAVPTGGPASGQMLTVLDNVAVNFTDTADLTGPDFQGITSLAIYIVFDGANQGSGSAKDYIGPVTLTGFAH